MVCGEPSGFAAEVRQDVLMPQNGYRQERRARRFAARESSMRNPPKQQGLKTM